MDPVAQILGMGGAWKARSPKLRLALVFYDGCVMMDGHISVMKYGHIYSSRYEGWLILVTGCGRVRIGEVLGRDP